MSDILNLVSDTTFADKLDEQNALLEDIKDALGGGSSEDVADLKNMVFPKLVLSGTTGTEFTLTKGSKETARRQSGKYAAGYGEKVNFY